MLILSHVYVYSVEVVLLFFADSGPGSDLLFVNLKPAVRYLLLAITIINACMIISDGHGPK